MDVRKTLPVNSLRKNAIVAGPPGTSENLPKQSIAENNPQLNNSAHPGRQLLSFFKQLASGTIFHTLSHGSSEHPNHLASSSSEYRMLIQESEKENKL